VTQAWTFVKGHWQSIALVVLVALGWSWYRSREAQTADVVRQLNESHQAEIDAVNKARADEEAEHAKELQDLRTSLDRINESYDAARKQLDARTVEARQDIVKRFGNDTAGLAQLVASRYGFAVVAPSK